MKRPTIAVVGSSNTDMVIKLPRLPRPGETILGGDFITTAGGKGANQAVAAARAGGEVTFIARVGKDSFGQQALEGFRRDGIRVEHVVLDARAPSGVALIFVAEDGENSIAVAPGSNARLSKRDIFSARAALETSAAVLMQLETPLPTVEEAARLASRRGSLVILNPAPARDLPDTLLRSVSVITPNETEASLLTGLRVNEKTAERVAAKLIRRGVKNAVVTLGSSGAYVADGSGGKLVPGFKVSSVDTTAAGDVFNGALAVALAEGRSLEEAARFANAAAAISVTRLGAQSSAPRRREIEQLLRG